MVGSSGSIAEARRDQEGSDNWLGADYHPLLSVIPSEARDLLVTFQRQYCVYILASRSRTLYTGITNNLRRRVWEHRQKIVPGFTRHYRIHRLVYFEPFPNVRDAIALEKRIKGWRRAKKVALIESANPAWDDLAASWFTPTSPEKQVPRSARNDRGVVQAR